MAAAGAISTHRGYGGGQRAGLQDVVRTGLRAAFSLLLAVIVLVSFQRARKVRAALDEIENRRRS
jgi:hypothetical protein